MVMNGCGGDGLRVVVAVRVGIDLGLINCRGGEGIDGIEIHGLGDWF